MTPLILALRPPKNVVDPFVPYAYHVEQERTRAGVDSTTAVVFLTNRECPFHCLMCDLWKNTTDERVPLGAIPAQIKLALARLPPAEQIKLYNAGNFFDAQAIPRADWQHIAGLVSCFQAVIVECHPRLVNSGCPAFRDIIATELQVAMGLETVHPEVLRALNKQMTLADFEKAARFLTVHEIPTRAFILLRPPFMSESEGIVWAKKSLDFAFSVGVECCVVIPTRAGNGALDELARQGQFQPPRLESLEEVLEYGLSLKRGRVFADLWDAGQLSSCECCGRLRLQRLGDMNMTQEIVSRVRCDGADENNHG